jgi:FixJ family two-component response regulator
MGLTPSETEIMTLFDGGNSPAEISAALGISVTRAHFVISTFDDSPRHDVRRENVMRRQTRRFGKLIRLAGGHR